MQALAWPGGRTESRTANVFARAVQSRALASGLAGQRVPSRQEPQPDGKDDQRRKHSARGADRQQQPEAPRSGPMER